MASQAELQLILSALDRASAQIKKVAGGVEQVGVSATRGSRGVDAFNRATHRTTAALGLLSPTAATATSQLTALTNLSGGATLALGGLVVGALAVGAGLLGSAKAAINFESSFAGIKKTVDGTNAEFAELEKQNRRLAIALGENVNAINEVGEAAGSLGIAIKDIARFERIVIELSRASDIAAGAAAFAFGGLISTLGLTIDEIDRLSDEIVDLGNKFVTTESEITDLLSRIAGAGAVLKIPAQNLAAIAAATKSTRLETELAGTAIQRALLGIQKAAIVGGDELEAFTLLLGLTAEQFKEMVRNDPTAVFLRFVEALGRSGEDAQQWLELLNLDPERTTRVFLTLAASNDLLRRSLVEGNKSFDEGTARTVEFEKRLKTTSAQIGQAKAAVVDLGIGIGGLLTPSVVGVSNAVEGAAGALGTFVSAVRSVDESLASLDAQESQALERTGDLAEAIVKLLAGLEGTGRVFPSGFHFFSNKLKDIQRESDQLNTHIKLLTLGVDPLTATFGFAEQALIQLEQGQAELDRRFQEGGLSVATYRAQQLGLIATLLETIKQHEALRNSMLDVQAAGVALAQSGALTTPFIQAILAAQSAVDVISGVSRAIAELAATQGVAAAQAAAFKIGVILPDLSASGIKERIDQIRAFVASIVPPASPPPPPPGGGAAKGAKEIDILADGIIDLAEAIANGISVEQAAVLELGKEAEEFANRLFRVAVETRKLALLNEPGAIRSRALLELAEAEVEAGKKTLELNAELAKLYITLSDGNSSIRQGADLLLESEVAFAKTQVELRSQMVALQVLLGQQGLTGKAGIFRNALSVLGEGFRGASESVTQFFQRLATASYNFAQSRFDALFNRPTRETAEIQLRIAELQRARLLRMQSSATEEELKVFDDQIAALQRNIDLKETENKILQLNATLADKTILTDQQQVSQAFLLIGVISQESALVKELNDRLAYEIFAQVGATAALNDFAAALREAHSVIQSQPGSAGGIAGGGVQVNVRVDAAPTSQDVVRAVARRTEQELARINFGGMRAMSGALRP